MNYLKKITFIAVMITVIISCTKEYEDLEFSSNKEPGLPIEISLENSSIILENDELGLKEHILINDDGYFNLGNVGFTESASDIKFYLRGTGRINDEELILKYELRSSITGINKNAFVGKINARLNNRDKAIFYIK